MARWSLCLGLIALVGIVPSRSTLQLGGTPLQLVAGRGSLWVLVCDRGCTGEARRSAGRIVRIDPRRGRIVASTPIDRPSALGVGPAGVFATDFWRDEVRRVDPETLQITARLRLTLPFELVPGDRAFLPEYVAAGNGAVWVSTARGVLVRIDPLLTRVVASVRLPFDATTRIAVTTDAVWVGESLLGLARVDLATNRVAARIRVGQKESRLAVDQVVAAGGRVFAVGAQTTGSTLANGSAVARIDPGRNRVEAVTPFAASSLAIAVGRGSVWVGAVRGSWVERIDPRNGAVTHRLRGRVGIALAFAGGRLWTVDLDGTLRRLPTS